MRRLNCLILRLLHVFRIFSYVPYNMALATLRVDSDLSEISSENNSVEPLVRNEIPSKVLQRMTLMSIFMVIALVGNVTVLSILLKSRAWKRPVSLFIISLAISDILIAIFSMSTEVFWDVFGGWIFGNFLCKFLTYIQCILFASTAFIHMSISFDRYEAICKPMLFSKRTAKNRWMIIGSWVLAILIAIPHPFVFLEVVNGEREDGSIIYACSSNGYTAEWQRKLYVSWIATYVFLVPLAWISFCYIKIACAVWKYDLTQKRQDLLSSCTSDFLSSRVRLGVPDIHRVILSRAKIKTVQVTICILASYTFCWTPYFTVSLLNVWTDYKYREIISTVPVGILAQCLCWFSSCVNPIIYGCFSLTDKIKANPCRCRSRRKCTHKPALMHYSHRSKILRAGELHLRAIEKEERSRSRPQTKAVTFPLQHDMVIFHTNTV